MKRLLVNRGIPGSGKSFNTNNLQQYFSRKGESVIVCSADHFHINAEGIYDFKAERLGYCHDQCFKRFIHAIGDGIDNIIIDNCNIRYKVFKQYVQIGILSRYHIWLLESNAPWRADAKECEKRNAHGVPLSTIEKMMRDYQSNDEIVDLIREFEPKRKYTVNTKFDTVMRAEELKPGEHGYIKQSDLLYIKYQYYVGKTTIVYEEGQGFPANTTISCGSDGKLLVNIEGDGNITEKQVYNLARFGGFTITDNLIPCTVSLDWKRIDKPGLLRRTLWEFTTK